MNEKDKKAVILLSGGLDSAVCLALSAGRYSKMTALTFNYKQKAADNEIKAAKSLADFYGINHIVINLDWLGLISNSALNTLENTPEFKEELLFDEEAAAKSAGAVWVPNRNALFINIGACFAEAYNFQDIIIGANKEEAAAFIDNTKEFTDAANELLKYSVNSKIEVKAPLLDMNKNEIAAAGIEFNAPFDLIYSCYNKSADNIHCGKCESCIRLKSALKNCGRNDIINSIFGG